MKVVELGLSLAAVGLLAAGIILHAVPDNNLEIFGFSLAQRPLWLLLLPAGNIAIVYLFIRQGGIASSQFILHELPVWECLMVIFSLLWLLTNGLTQQANAFAVFFTWPIRSALD